MTPARGPVLPKVSALVLAAAVLLAACGSGGDSATTSGDSAPFDDDSPAEDGDLLEIGASVYAAMCASCHGPEGEGGAGPGFEGVVERYPEVADHVEVVESGVGVMPPFGGSLDATEIEAVVAYEREVLDAGS